MGALCVAAAWFYTGGARPYGYHGLGEVMVFVFFGLVAVLGTTYVQTGTLPLPGWYAGAGDRLARLRHAGRQQPARHPDRPRGRASGRWRCVLGDEQTRYLFGFLVALAGVFLVGRALETSPWALVGLAFVVPVTPALRRVLGGARGPALVPVLQDVGVAELVYATGVFVALVTV